jgi:alpha-ketoglutarate-dependent taurine dioxygenase
MKTIPLSNGAVEITEFDIRDFTYDDAIQVRDILRKELVVVIREQDRDPLNYAKLIHYIGGICNWDQCGRDIDGNKIGNYGINYPDIENWDRTKPFPVQRVTGEKKDGEFTGIFPLGKLDWHCNLNGPNRADGVALQGIKGAEGTRTSWNNTGLALKEMPKELRDRIHGKYAKFFYNPTNWSDIHNKEQLAFMLKNRHHYTMWIEQTNAGGVEGLYLYTTNDCEIPGDDTTLFTELQDFLFQEKFIYHHDWSIGDIVLSDQLLTMHKRRQEDDAIFENRVLNRLTFRITNTGNPPALIERNKIV